MSGRIITLQRQARELGRLRTGYTDTSGEKPRPVRSGTWIITSHAEHYVRAAAEEWGGTPEKWQPLGNQPAQWRVMTEANALDAIMPPGDPLSQAYEMWSKGGCARRCDGATEQLSDRPCLCQQQFGDEWWTQRKGDVCQATTRLNVILPQMPDVGVWRMETHSHYAANEVAAHVDLIRSATHGETAVPVRLRIEQRQRVANGQTKNFPVIAVELRGVTAGQILGGTVMGGQLDAAPPRQAIAAGSAAPVLDVDSVRAAIAAIDNLQDLRAIWKEAKDAGLTEEVTARARELQREENWGPVDRETGQPPKPAEPAEEDGDPDELWAKVMRTVPEGWTTSEVEKDFEQFAHVPADKAGAADMRRYLDHLAGATAKAAS